MKQRQWKNWQLYWHNNKTQSYIFLFLNSIGTTLYKKVMRSERERSSWESLSLLIFGRTLNTAFEVDF